MTRTDTISNSLPLSFPITKLDMSPYIAPNAVDSAAPPSQYLRERRRSQKKVDALYDLYSCIVHIAGTGESGHWVNYCYVQDSESSPTSESSSSTAAAKAPAGWFRLDDSTISPTSESAVSDLTPYMLFYVRRDDSGTSLFGKESNDTPDQAEPVAAAPSHASKMEVKAAPIVDTKTSVKKDDEVFVDIEVLSPTVPESSGFPAIDETKKRRVSNVGAQNLRRIKVRKNSE